MAEKQTINWLDMVPVVKKNIGTKFNNEGLAAIVIPRFNKAWMVKLFLPKNKKNEINLQLDANGTAVWKEIDGTKTVRDIIRSLAEVGEGQEQFDNRVVLFIQNLYRNGFISVFKHG